MKHGSSLGKFFEVMVMEYGSKTARSGEDDSVDFFGLDTLTDLSNHDDIVQFM